jgi:sterol desaturase/sphingolipid hydroxylase (fatty acid hydroxylase superfamily)
LISVDLIKKLVTKSSNLFLFIFLPILVTTFFELFKKGLNFNNFKDSSVGRLAISEGSKGADIWYWLLNIFQTKFPVLLTFFTLGTSVINSGAEKSIFSTFDKLYSSILPFENIFAYSLILVIGILLQELVGYVRHRIIHTVPFFWDLHEFHHSATEMTIFSQFRIAPVESIFLDSLQIPFAVFFGLMISKSLAEGSFVVLTIYVVHSILGSIYTYYGHSSLKIVYPKPISYVIQSPSCHWLHHSANPDHFNCNFGATYTFWDKLFGTFLDESNLDDINGFGVEDTEYNKHHPLYSYLILPVIRITKRIRNLSN